MDDSKRILNGYLAICIQNKKKKDIKWMTKGYLPICIKNGNEKGYQMDDKRISPKFQVK